jgi:PKD repeat protein
MLHRFRHPTSVTARATRPTPRTRGTSRRRRGQSVVEFALIVPVLAFILLVAVDFGRLFFTYVQVGNAAREAANYAATNPGDQGGIQLRATQEKNAQKQTGEGSLTVATPTCKTPAGLTIACGDAAGAGGAGNIVTVKVTQPFSFMTPFITNFFGGNLNITVDASSALLVSAVGGGGSVPTCDPPSVPTFSVLPSGMDVILNPSGSLPDTGDCAIIEYRWEFGDGTDDVGESIPVSHTYANPGTFNIRLEVANTGGTAEAFRSVTVPFVPTPTPTTSASPSASASASTSPSPSPSCAPPTANFTWDPQSPRRKVQFTDTSTFSPASCLITTWFWQFYDNGTSNPPSVTNAQNPLHEFPSNNGNYQVRLTVTNAGGSITITRMVNL